jgi:hypothetical protein
MQPKAHVQAKTTLCLELVAEVLDGALHTKGSMYCPARAVFVGNRGAEKCHNSIAGVLIDAALEAVYLSAH